MEPFFFYGSQQWTVLFNLCSELKTICACFHYIFCVFVCYICVFVCLFEPCLDWSLLPIKHIALSHWLSIYDTPISCEVYNNWEMSNYEQWAIGFPRQDKSQQLSECLVCALNVLVMQLSRCRKYLVLLLDNKVAFLFIEFVLLLVLF